jgi:hypothetical protein
MRDVLDTQLPAFQSSDRSVKDSATISIGGNDVDFVGILKACIFRTWFSGECDDRVQAAQRIIDGIAHRLADVYTRILDAAVAGGAPYHFTLFATGKLNPSLWPFHSQWPLRSELEANVGVDREMQVMPSFSTAPPRSATMSALTCYFSGAPDSQPSYGKG